MGWSYWDDYNERNTDVADKPEPTPEELERRRKQAEQAKIRAQKRIQLKRKFALTKGQFKRIYNKGNCNIDELLAMTPTQIQTELRKRWHGRNDQLSMKVKGA